MLKSIYIVTLLVMSVTRSEQAYEDNLGYETIDEGEIAQELAAAWGKPNVAGRPYVLMQAESGAEVYLRFIEVPDKGNYEPMKTLGWNAVELQALDPDTLVTELDAEHFEMIGAPAYLTDKENIRAAQVLGPDRELLYFTHVLDPTQTSFNIGTANTRVDRVFIMVLGTQDLGATSDFYSTMFEQPVSGPWPYRVSVLSRAWGRPADTIYDLSIAQLQEAFLLEIDGYPEEAPMRSATSAGLPFGPSVVSFRVGSLDRMAARANRQAHALSMAPYNGAHSLLLEGPSGEMIELVGTAGPGE